MKKRHEVKAIKADTIPHFDTSNFDIIHILDIKELSVSLINYLEPPVIMEVHDHYWTEFKSFPTIDLPVRLYLQKRRIARYPDLLNMAAKVISHSEHTHRQINHPRGEYVPYAIDAEKFASARQSANRENIIAFIGRDYLRKGLPALISALKTVRKLIKDVKLVVAGKEYFHSRAYCGLLAKGAPVEFVGAMDERGVIDLLSRAKVLALPSWDEAFGITLLEAHAAGVPTVGTNVGGIPEALDDGRAGLLVERGNVRELAKALIKCLEGGKDIEEMKANALENLKTKYTPDVMADSLERVYQKTGTCSCE